jgi:hypothetical protein
MPLDADGLPVDDLTASSLALCAGLFAPHCQHSAVSALTRAARTDLGTGAHDPRHVRALLRVGPVDQLRVVLAK